MSWDRRAIILGGLGYGDEGKGAWTDFLARAEPVHTVVRFNGGAQAGHNVVTPDGRHHTFAQFGSGTFVRGVNTHLSRFMLLNPIRLLREDDQLRALGVTDALARLSIDRRALVTTPFQVAANRLREIARGDGRHGSCGMGVGETMADWLAYGDRMLTAGDLSDAATVRAKLHDIRDLKLVQLGDLLQTMPESEAADRERSIFDNPKVIDGSVSAYRYLSERVRPVGDGYLGELLDFAGTVVFEGAQGALLDEWQGFHPYTTWSTTTFQNALTLLSEAAYDGEVVKVGLLRAYMSRHGAGPFVTEEPMLAPTFTDPYNVPNDWQHGFRVGPLDAVAARYAIGLSARPDVLALSHLDQLQRADNPRIAAAYRYLGSDPDVGQYVATEDGLIVGLRPSSTPEDLNHQERLTCIVQDCAPVYRSLPAAPDALIAAVQEALGVPVGLVASGPTADNRTFLPSWPLPTDE